MTKKKEYLSQDLSSRDLMVANTVMAVLDCSKSHLTRLITGEARTATPFPKPFKIGLKTNFWRRSEITGWIDAQQEAARGAK